MTRNKGIVDALIGLRKAGQAVQLPQRGKQSLTARQSLVDIGLVTHVEHQPILRGVKHPVDRHRQFDHAQIGRKMPAGFRHVFQQKLPQLTAELRQLFLIEFPDVRRGMNTVQNHNDLQRS